MKPANNSLLRFYMLLVICSLSSVSCKHEYSYEAGRNAVYRFSGSPDACTNVLLNGFFYKGTPADTNSITAEVQVTVSGTYSFTTDTVHGVSFSASGTFSDTGFQMVRLTGKGTPDTTGELMFRIIDSTGCSFTVPVQNEVTPGYSFVGSPNQCIEAEIKGTYTAGTKMNSSNEVIIQAYVRTPAKIDCTTPVVNGMSFSGGGSFTSTGTLGVPLQASGTPQEAGIFHYVIQQDTTLCGFDITVLNAPPYAVYVLQSFPGNNNIAYCSSASVQGAYTAGTALTSGNTLTINPFVSTPGNYTISTTEINGMKFSASGTFASAGSQSVVLKGSGTPATIGTFTFVPQIVGPAPQGGAYCGVDVEIK